MATITGSCIVTKAVTPQGVAYTFSWTSDAAGAVKHNVEQRISGRLIKFETIPTDPPTDNYDITLSTPDKIDVLAGLGADRDTALSETKWLFHDSDPLANDVWVNDYLQFVVAAAGNAKSGRFILYVSPSGIAR